MIRISLDTDIGINQNSSNWLGMNSYPILSPGLSSTFKFLYKMLFWLNLTAYNNNNINNIILNLNLRI